MYLWSSADGCQLHWGATVCRDRCVVSSLKDTFHGPIMGKLISLFIVIDESVSVPRVASVWARQMHNMLYDYLSLSCVMQLPIEQFYIISITHFHIHVSTSLPSHVSAVLGFGWSIKRKTWKYKPLWVALLGGKCWSCKWDRVNLYSAKLCRYYIVQPPLCEYFLMTTRESYARHDGWSSSHRCRWHTNLK